jgi:uncharacterized surface protein with fasciclin (FAS1) repeats
MNCKKTWIKNAFLMLMSIFMFNACEDKMDEHYEVPEWLKGNAWEVLEARGNYSVFLEGADLAGFRPVLEGKSLVTVMAPDDEAFAQYLSAAGKSSVEDFSVEELKRLIGFHLMYYSYDKDMLVNFRPQEGDGATEEEKLVKAGLYYKHRTRSYEAPATETDPETGSDVTVYHNERLLPVLSYRMFDTKGIDAKYNYEYFYPSSEWTGNDGFNVSNAGVTEYGVVTDNGYIYMVDRVLEPLETIYKELQSREEYSRYLELYDQYSYYELDEQLTTDFGNGTDLYRHYHDPLANIACEWPGTNYRDIATLSYQAYSVFAPSNTAFDSFFESYWRPGGYTSLSEVNETAMAYLLYNSVYREAIVFPEEIKNGDIVNSFDMKIDFDVDAVPTGNRVMCQNGVLYGLDQLDAPAMFTSVTGPAFRYKDFSWYLYMLSSSDMLVGLSSPDAALTVLIPSNEQMTEGGISVVDDALWSSDDGDLAPLSTGTMTNIVNLHTVTGGTGIGSSGTQVLRTNIAYTYWYVKDGKMITSVLFNQKFMNPSTGLSFVGLHELTYDGAPWSNGKAYAYDYSELFRPLSSTSLQTQLAITRDESYPYYRFSELLRNAGLVNSTDGELNFLSGKRCLVFIPTNEVLEAAILAGKIPGVAANGSVTAESELAAYLKCYFLLTEDNGMTTYPYPGSGINGEYDTLSEHAGENVKMIIQDDGQSLSIRLSTPGVGQGSVVNVAPGYDYFPFAFDDGGAHYVSGVL